ncbi:uncharacterized protein LOC126706835 [Quercus robur]|nr:uncharacterized protein LOC126706835 [Quercus robur]
MMPMPTVDSSIMFIKKRRLMEVIPPSWRNMWTEWQLRVLVLFSLSTQIILVVLGKRRKRVSGSWIRFTVWSAYLLADSIALMAAGIISNELGGVNDANGLVDPKHELVAFWAPILLLHLGGTDTITAYSLEDNELWKRHSLGVVIQAISTLYIWLTAWTSPSLSLLSFLIFIVGLMKYGERVRVLFLASEKTFRDSIPDILTDNSKIMEKCKLKQLEGYHLTKHLVFEVEVPDLSTNKPLNDVHPDADELLEANRLLEMVKRLFADFIISSQDRDVSVKIFQELSALQAFKVIDIELGFIYDFLYTKANVIYSRLGIALRIIAIFIISIVLGLFLNLKERHHHSKIDVIITWVLLAVALFMELYAFRELLISDQTAYWLIKNKKTTFLEVINRTLRSKAIKTKRWSNSIGQFSLLSLALSKKTLPLYGILQIFGIDEMLEIHLAKKKLKKEKLESQPYDIPQEHSIDIQYLIFWAIRNIVRESPEVSGSKLEDLYGLRGGRTLEKFQRRDLSWSVELEFDQSILIWHLATEICYFKDFISPNGIHAPANEKSGEREPKEAYSEKGLLRQRCNYLSRYMLYLLVKHPNMLPIGMARIKFRDIYTEVGDFIEEHTGESVEHIELKAASKKLSKVKSEVMLTVGGRDRSRRDRSNNVIFHACKLVSALGEDEKKWELIKNVWLEMLGHAASQCKGRLHAQQLRRGGELLTHVWLLMAHFGLSDHFQKSRSRVIAETIIR